MGFSTPLGLLALLAVPAVLFLHLFRRRFRERRVAGLFLFAADALPAAAGRTRTRLLHTPSLWLELLAATALGLWLGGLCFGGGDAEPHWVVVLDDSASMAAVGPAGDTTQRARAWIEEQLDALPATAEVTLVSTGRRPLVVAGPRAQLTQARAALAAWAPARPAHDPAAAWELGLDLAGRDGELVFITDRDDRVPPPRYRVRAFGEPLDNAAIVGARRLGRGAEERVFVDLLAWGEAPWTTRVVLEAVSDEGARSIAERDVELTPGRALHLAWSVPATPLALRVRLGDDALAVDNRVTLLPEPIRVVPVYVGLDEEAAGALRLGRVLDALPGVAVVDEPARARLLFTGRGEAAPVGVTQVVVAAPGAERDAWIGPFLLERRRVLGGRHGTPLLQGLSLEGVVWSAGRGSLPGLPLVLAGEQVLLAEDDTPRGVRLHLNLDPRRSNLSASPDWPILLSNLVEHVRGGLPGPLAVNVRLGGEIALRFGGSPQEAAGLSLFEPGGAGRPARGWPLLGWEARRVGIHRLVQDERDLARFAVNFVDPAESDLRERATADLPATRAARSAAASAGPHGAVEARILALLLLLALVADWFVLGRRR